MSDSSRADFHPTEKVPSRPSHAINRYVLENGRGSERDFGAFVRLNINLTLHRDIASKTAMTAFRRNKVEIHLEPHHAHLF